MSNIGFGDNAALFRVYVANRPPMAEYAYLDTCLSLQKGEIDTINSACGNGWRKVFNVYAKLLFALNDKQFSFKESAPSWQQYRDSHLLQDKSSTALLFDAPIFECDSKVVHIVAGRTHAKALIESGVPAQLVWLNNEFAIDKHLRLLVCPYFDYRQLNNEKIAFLSGLIASLDT